MAIQLILASQSPSRRNVLASAGIRALVRVSHVDEPAVLASEAEARGVSVDDLGIGDRVAILARAKASVVADECRQMAEVIRDARGDVVTAYPVKAMRRNEAMRAGTGDMGAGTARHGSDAGSHEVSMMTRDFSGLTIPMTTTALRGSLIEAYGRDAGNDGDDGNAGPLLLGCDSLFAINGRIQGKPHTADVARARLRSMRGRSGELWTGHTLIDLASGRSVSGTSHAVVRFGDYDDADIDDYVATGEPLEIAGSFALEGLGGAFVDGVDGDPHGVLGLSLPLVRRLARDLGVRWSDMWNMRRTPIGGSSSAASGKSTDAPSPSDAAPTVSDTPTVAVAPASAAPVSAAPADNVHQPGDGWVDCACGRRHWGLNGAAGVLLARRDGKGHVTHVVMQHRALWSAEGGTWGIPGGAIADGENAVEGALRESHEEAGISPGDIRVVGAYREDHGPWAYTTIIAFEREGHRVDPVANDDESMNVTWVPVEDVPSLRLLTAFRADWPNFRRRLDDLSGSGSDSGVR